MRFSHSILFVSSNRTRTGDEIPVVFSYLIPPFILFHVPRSFRSPDDVIGNAESCEMNGPRNGFPPTSSADDEEEEVSKNEVPTQESAPQIPVSGRVFPVYLVNDPNLSFCFH